MTVEELAGYLPFDKQYVLKDIYHNTVYKGGLSPMLKADFEYADWEIGMIHDFDYDQMIIYIE